MGASAVRILILLISLLVSLLHCTGKEEWAGKYLASAAKEPTTAIHLELKDNGQGFWTREEEQVPFEWEVRGKEIWLHTRTGGLIVGKLRAKSIEIHLPGAGVFLFKKPPL